MRVADFIAHFISRELGVRDVFMLTGAGIMHLTDGVACNSELRPICVQHEQAAAMALEAYARTNEHFGVGYFSTGPAALNALTGLGGAWQDSVPCMFISGQVKRTEASHTAGVPGLRQFGVQEIDVIPVVSSLCKYVVHLTDPQLVRYELEKAVALAREGRPGPVWIDIPLDVQAAMVDPELLPSYTEPTAQPRATEADVRYLAASLRESKRPVIIAGRGIRLAGAQQKLLEFAQRLHVPVVTPFLGIDNIAHNVDVYIGKTGIKGDRAANLAMQNSDLILAIGTSLHVSVIGYDYAQFARAARRFVVDIDPTAHLKQTIDIDRLIISDAKELLSDLADDPQLSGEFEGSSDWLDQCNRWKQNYPVCLAEYAIPDERVNIYSLVDMLSEMSSDGDVFIADAGSAYYAVSQGIRLDRPGQRYLASGAMATMGYSLPAAIGASAALGDQRVIAITGDGSLQQNLQEFQTLIEYGFPVKLFVLNNDGYLSIRASQRNYFENRYIGEGPSSGVSLPDTLKLCQAFGLDAIRVSTLRELRPAIRSALAAPGPFVVDVLTPPDQLIIPTVASMVNPDGSMTSRPLEDMAPFLDRTEYRSNLFIDPV